MAHATEATRIVWDTFTQLKLGMVELVRQLATLQAQADEQPGSQREAHAPPPKEHARESCRRRCGADH
jgi:hypothetical protein